MRIRRLIRSCSRVLRTLTAVSLLVVAFGDLAIDVDCDPLAAIPGASAVTLAADGDTDACAGGCIPDCFCCARTLGAQARVLPPAPDGVAPTVAVVSPGLPPGFSLLDEHPPRARA